MKKQSRTLALFLFFLFAWASTRQSTRPASIESPRTPSFEGLQEFLSKESFFPSKEENRFKESIILEDQMTLSKALDVPSFQGSLHEVTM